MRVLITGGGGQLGCMLHRRAPPGAAVTALPSARLDVRDAELVLRTITEIAPDLVINAAAYNAVDKAEQDSHACYAVNATGAANVALACAAVQARLIHVSTDFVFDGAKSSPYRPDDSPTPLGVYGASKRDGEEAVLTRLPDRALVVRTAWLYAAGGNNFVATMLRSLRQHDEIKVVCDQVGTPTHARGLAEVLWRFGALENLAGIYHWSDAGVASWYDFAVAIREEADRHGMLRRAARIVPVSTEEYGAAAPRPRYSVLDKSKTYADLQIAPSHWRSELRTMFEDLQPPEH